MNIKEINLVVKKIINDQDPLHLIELGAPEDEYNMEIGEIAFRIMNKNTAQRVRDIVKAVFKEKFDEETVKNSLKNLESIGDMIEKAIK